MKKRVIVYPYNMGSMSGRKLARSFDRGLRVYPDRTYRPRPSDLIVNWGSSTYPTWLTGEQISRQPVLNWWGNVKMATNKLVAFNEMRTKNVEVPRFTTDVHEAYEWDCPVIARSLLRSHSGRGAHFVDYEDRNLLLGSLANCPLYVEYIKKSAEYRVHVFKGEVIDVQEKKVREGSSGNNYRIRSYSNGWVFCRDGIDVPDSIISNSILAVESLGLDFGAVDAVWNTYYERAVVLEVNTAPGLHGSTTATYVDAINSLIKGVE